MLDDDPTFDPTIKLVPIEEYRSRPKSRVKSVLYLAIAFGVLLSASTVFAIVWKLIQIKQSRFVAGPVTSQSDSASLRNESVSVFAGYDAAQDRVRAYSPEETRERNDIFALIHQLESCTTMDNTEEFRSLVDFDRQLKRVEQITNMSGWSDFEKRTIRSQMRSLAEQETFWGHLKVAGIVTPADDRDTRIVYAHARAGDFMDSTEYRFWIGRAGSSWKLYDWARLDLGLSESQKWATYIKYFNSPQMEGFKRWNELIADADELTADNQRGAAAEKLRLAESQLIPEEFQGYRWFLTGHRWIALDDDAEAERCYLAVQEPDDTPGVYLGLASSLRTKRPAEALRNLGLYEQTVGATPDTSETKAQLLEGLGLHAESMAAWKQVLRINPANRGAGLGARRFAERRPNGIRRAVRPNRGLECDR